MMKSQAAALVCWILVQVYGALIFCDGFVEKKIFSSISSKFFVGEKNLPGFGSGSGLRFLAGSGFNEYGSETLPTADHFDIIKI